MIQANLFDETELRKLMDDYTERKEICRIFGKDDPLLNFFDRCLNNLEYEEKDLIEKTCLQKMSLRQYARETGYARTTVTRERDRILKLLVKFFRLYEDREEKKF